MLLRLQRYKQLEFGGSESDRSSQDLTDMEDLREEGPDREKFINTLAGWQSSTFFEKKLLLGILHRNSHKDFVEIKDSIEEKK